MGRTLNLIAGDGQTNVLHLNTLDYERWAEKIHEEAWQDVYGEGWKKLRKLRAVKDQNRDFQFDVLMANPPFAGDIKETRILAKYELARTVSLDKIAKVDATTKQLEAVLVDLNKAIADERAKTGKDPHYNFKLIADKLSTLIGGWRTLKNMPMQSTYRNVIGYYNDAIGYMNRGFDR